MSRFAAVTLVACCLVLVGVVTSPAGVAERWVAIAILGASIAFIGLAPRRTVASHC